MTKTLTMKPRTRVTWTAAERAEWLALFEKSGRRAAQFCRDNGLSPATLSLWLRQQQTPVPSAEESLVELPRGLVNAAAAGAMTTTAGVTMQLAGGVRLEIAAGTDAAWLGQLLPMLLAGRA